MSVARPPLRSMIGFESGPSGARRAIAPRTPSIYNCDKCGTVAPPISEMGVRSCSPR
jgi:hypothetical protein